MQFLASELPEGMSGKIFIANNDEANYLRLREWYVSFHQILS